MDSTPLVVKEAYLCILPVQIFSKVVSLFSACTAVFCTSILLSIVFIVFRNGLADVLGGRGDIKTLLAEYIYGYSFGITGQILFRMMVVFFPVNVL